MYLDRADNLWIILRHSTDFLPSCVSCDCQDDVAIMTWLAAVVIPHDVLLYWSVSCLAPHSHYTQYISQDWQWHCAKSNCFHNGINHNIPQINPIFISVYRTQFNTTSDFYDDSTHCSSSLVKRTQQTSIWPRCTGLSHSQMIYICCFY